MNTLMRSSGAIAFHLTQNSAFNISPKTAVLHLHYERRIGLVAAYSFGHKPEQVLYPDCMAQEIPCLQKEVFEWDIYRHSDITPDRTAFLASPHMYYPQLSQWHVPGSRLCPEFSRILDASTDTFPHSHKSLLERTRNSQTLSY